VFLLDAIGLVGLAAIVSRLMLGPSPQQTTAPATEEL